MNAAITIERVKKRWNDEEISMLANAERNLPSGTRFYNISLHEIFPGRSVEAIKKMRQSQRYMNIMGSLGTVDPLTGPSGNTSLPGLAPTPGPSNTANVLPAAPTEHDYESPIIEALKELRSRPSEDSFNHAQLDHLVDLAIAGERDLISKMDDYARATFAVPPSERSAPQNHAPETARTTKKRLRRREYAKTQDLYRRDRARCASEVLDGRLDLALIPQVAAFVEAWTPIFGAPSRPAPMEEYPPLEQHVSSIWAPISSEEISGLLKGWNTAPGPDGFTARLLKSVPSAVILKLFNLALLLRNFPPFFDENRTIFIPKSDIPDSALDFRPITISSVVVRAFHKIIASRLTLFIPLSSSQRAFLPADGVAENVALLSSIISSAKHELKEVHIAVLDLRKAFDSVSHQAIMMAARAHGVPPPCVEYISKIYSRCFTRFSVRGAQSDPVRMTCGVRQGDPLSPWLFNAVIDLLITKLPPHIGYNLGGTTINNEAFADDLDLIASTRLGLQSLLDTSNSTMTPLGPKFNIDKCGTISYVPSGKEKKLKVDTSAPFRLGDHELPLMSCESEWKYLGITFGAFGRLSKPAVDLQVLLGRIKKAPLKPQQRLAIIRDFLIPRLLHTLILGPTNTGSLTSIDIRIREAVREFLHLPKDVPTAFFHAAVPDGGLGIPSLRWSIPHLKASRIGNLRHSPVEVFQSLPDLEPLRSDLRRASNWMRFEDENMDTAERVFNMFRKQLYASIDGQGLRHSRDVKVAHSWVREANRLMTGFNFINATKIRINALPCKSRTTRGRPHLDRRCRAGCHNSIETAAHILQVCHRTHGVRIQRHNNIARYVAGRLKQKNFHVEEETHFKTADGLRKPDILAVKEQKAYFIDAQIVTCGDDGEAHRRKINYYKNNEDLMDQLKAGTGADDTDVLSITLNWRGVWDKKSAEQMRDVGLTNQDLKLISVRVLEAGCRAWRFFNHMTSRRPDTREGVG